MSYSIFRVVRQGALLIVLSASGAAMMARSALSQDTAQANTNAFTIDPKGATSAHLPYYPIRVKLSTEKPAGITKEPAYKATPKYATIHVGNGPNATYYLALDEPANGDWKIYFDKNRDGDLTNDGDGAWSDKKVVNPTRTVYGINTYVVKASYGTPTQETSSADYGLSFYRITGIDDLLMFRAAVRSGTILIDGQPHKAQLVENDADALYDKALNDDGKPVNGGAETRPVWLIVDMDGKPQMVDARSPFKLGDKAYVAQIAMDGSSVTLAPTTRKVPERKEPQEKPLLKAGTQAPDFAVNAYNGGTKHLSDYRGKVLVLDFWATWCGPCQASMPHLERVYKAVRKQGVAVLGVCSWDDKDAYTKWVPENKTKYTFPTAFDPAGRNGDKSIAGSLYNVSGIPTTYIIDKNGKVIDSVVGYEDGDTRVEAALKKAGVKITSDTK